MNAVDARLVGRRGPQRASADTADDPRLGAQGRLVSLRHRREEGVEVDVENRRLGAHGRHASTRRRRVSRAQAAPTGASSTGVPDLLRSRASGGDRGGMKTSPYVARSPEDLIALVPFVLGFHPSESVVLPTFGAPDGSFHARVDLPDGPDDRAQVCEILCNAVRRNRAPMTAVIVFSREVERSAAVCADLVPALLGTGASVVD